jgi:hypothetical protein
LTGGSGSSDFNLSGFAVQQQRAPSRHLKRTPITCKILFD